MSKALFIVDIASCTGCHACSVACKDRAGLPDELDHLRVETYEEGVYPDPILYHRVVHCFHCAQPACAVACPVDAISKDENALTIIDEEECTGCGDCVHACPFGAIIMLPDGGIASKCDGCADEVARGWDPTCVRACPMRALRYEPADGSHFENRIRDPDFKDSGIGPGVLYLRRCKSQRTV